MIGEDDEKEHFPLDIGACHTLTEHRFRHLKHKGPRVNIGFRRPTDAWLPPKSPPKKGTGK